MSIATKRGPLFAILLAVVMLAGCASRAVDDDESAGDPLEGLNRHIFTFNKSVDIFLIRPLAVTYRDLVPEGMKRAIDNFLSFINTPVVLANDLLQGDFKRADITAQRFMQNMLTLGFGDVAADAGMPGHQADFGLTLASWGAGDGPYFVIPVLGPTNTRDGIGLAVDVFLAPITWVSRIDGLEALGYADLSLRYITYRAAAMKDLDQIEAQSLDYYATMRSLYKQYRDGLIRELKPNQKGSLPSYKELLGPTVLADPSATTTSAVAP
jgi:phospholipid-binding lipoprotein MlaA